MSDLSKYIVKHNASIKFSIGIIDANAAQVALIVNDDNKLAGIITDGDIRRAILSNHTLDDPVSSIMTKCPITLPNGATHSDALKVMRESLVHHIPVINDDRSLVDLFVLDDLIKKQSINNTVVIMAGGKGERLGSLTKNCPKPMLEVNGKPILEIILEKCIDAGFNNFSFSVNYLKEKIIDYFEAGQKWGVIISYLEEKEPLGTCGSLTLLPNNLTDDILVLNGDILTDLDYGRLMTYHQKSRNAITICTRSHRVRIPFAVMTTSGVKLERFVEKPMYEFQVNAGVYILNPSLIEKIPSKFYNMTDLVDDLLDSKSDVGVFPIHENWKDIGNPIDFKEATETFH